MLRMIDPPEIQEETNKLLREWMKIPEDDSPEFEDFMNEHCSERMKEYLRECEEIQAQLEPGEYV